MKKVQITDDIGNIIKVDKPVDVGFNFSSTARNPKKDQRGFFEKYVTIRSARSGLAVK